MSVTPVHELDLPEVDFEGLERRDAVARLRALGRDHWLARSPLGYAVTRYDDVVALLRERRFHSALSLIPRMQGLDAGILPDDRPKSILAMEGDEHNRTRRLVSPAFTPARSERLRPFMDQVMNDLVDPVAAVGRCELVADVCEPYPIPIICELLGAPKEDWRKFSVWATDIFRIFNQNLAEDAGTIQEAFGELGDYLSEMIERRRSQPADDLLSALIAVEEEGDRLSTDELIALVATVLMAGTDTTRNQLACSMAVFAEHPDQWALLAERPDLAPRAVEEAMRYLGAVSGTIRVASEDITYRDVRFPAGTLVMTSLAAANLDDAAWQAPGAFDIAVERGPAHLTFGWGTHFCLGASLARAELQEALVILARRMPNLALEGPVTWKPSNFGIWGPAELSVRFDPVS